MGGVLSPVAKLKMSEKEMLHSVSEEQQHEYFEIIIVFQHLHTIMFEGKTAERKMKPTCLYLQ